MNQFFKQVFASLIGTIAGLSLFFLVGTSSLILLLIAATSQPEARALKYKSVLVFDLSTEITDGDYPISLNETLQSTRVNRLNLRQVLEAIKRAQTDEQIVAIFLDGRGGGSNNGYGTLAEIRAALLAFQAAGKQVIAYDDSWLESEYYLGSVASTLFMEPTGVMELNGFSSQQLFLEKALAKYGIGIQVVRVGEYKSAVEPFTRQGFSPENAQQTQALLQELWSEYREKVATQRQLSPSALQAIADQEGLLDADTALEAKLVDQKAYYDQVQTELQALTEGENRTLTLSQYVALQGQTNSSPYKVAIVYCEGSIVDGQGNITEVGGDRFAAVIRELRNDENVKALVIRINSPGGSATAAETIWREIQLTQETKPVVVSMGNVAASGGYWLATAAPKIFAENSTITGSIGVFALLFNLQEIANSNGLNWESIKTAELADIFTNTRPKTEAELAIYQKYVQQTYDLFLDRVAESRNLSREEVAKIAQGRVWSGKQALALGLVDEIGGLEAAIAYAAQAANLGDDWQVIEYPTRQLLKAQILERLLESEILSTTPNLARDPLTQIGEQLQKGLAILKTLNDPKSVYARLFLNTEIQ